jgi:hypothetical protein
MFSIGIYPVSRVGSSKNKKDLEKSLEEVQRTVYS